MRFERHGYGLAEIGWHVLAVICDWMAARRLTNWPAGWFHVYCERWTTFCNRHRLWRP